MVQVLHCIGVSIKPPLSRLYDIYNFTKDIVSRGFTFVYRDPRKQFEINKYFERKEEL